MSERARAWIDKDGTLRAPEGYVFEMIDLPGYDAYGYPRKGVRIVRVQTPSLKGPEGPKPCPHCGRAHYGQDWCQERRTQAQSIADEGEGK